MDDRELDQRLTKIERIVAAIGLETGAIEPPQEEKGKQEKTKKKRKELAD